VGVRYRNAIEVSLYRGRMAERTVLWEIMLLLSWAKKNTLLFVLLQSAAWPSCAVCSCCAAEGFLVRTSFPLHSFSVLPLPWYIVVKYFAFSTCTKLLKSQKFYLPSYYFEYISTMVSD
jgi:hypothetical protein